MPLLSLVRRNGWIGGGCLLLLCPALLAQEPTPAHRADGRWLTEWLVLEGYLSGPDAGALIERVATRGDGPAQAGQSFTTADGKSLDWRRISQRGDYFELRGWLGPEFAGGSAFAVCHLVAAAAGEVELHLCSQSNRRLWLNGQLLTPGRGFREERFDLRPTVPLTGTLRAGTNTLLVQAERLDTDAGFALRALPAERVVITGSLLDGQGKPITDGKALLVVRQGDEELARIGTDLSGL